MSDQQRRLRVKQAVLTVYIRRPRVQRKGLPVRQGSLDVFVAIPCVEVRTLAVSMATWPFAATPLSVERGHLTVQTAPLPVSTGTVWLIGGTVNDDHARPGLFCHPIKPAIHGAQ
ncbi:MULTISPECIES: hypothetical protein [Methylomonas]|uniref:hypothetical protein n=1 Tax=Methylomonas TaxID=416 RepID=UPI000B23AFF7|nr:hypothetical protein [Methylomonas koyamae]